MRISPRMFAAAAVLLVLAGCAALPARATTRPHGTHTASIADYIREQLGEMAGVESVIATQKVLPPPDDLYGRPVKPDPHPNLWDASLWNIEIGVILTADVTPGMAWKAAKAERELSELFAVPGGTNWRAAIRGSVFATSEEGVVPLLGGPASLIYPGDGYAVEVARTALGANYPGLVVDGVAMEPPMIATVTPEQLSVAYDALQENPRFGSGGDYWADDGRVRIADVPDHLTDGAVHAILEAASAYPTAEFWLQTPRDQNHWPTLYVNHLAPGEDVALAARFSAHELAAANVTGTALPYVITQSMGGPALSGTFGGVPTP